MGQNPSTSYVNVPETASLESSVYGVTVAAWVNAASIVSGNAYDIVDNSYPGAAPNQGGYVLAILPSSVASFGIYNSAPPTGGHGANGVTTVRTSHRKSLFSIRLSPCAQGMTRRRGQPPLTAADSNDSQPYPLRMGQSPANAPRCAPRNAANRS